MRKKIILIPIFCIVATALAIIFSTWLLRTPQGKGWIAKRDMHENEKTIFQGTILSRPIPAEPSNTYFIIKVKLENINIEVEEKVIVHYTDFTKDPSNFEPGDLIYFTSIFIAASRNSGFYGYLDPSHVNPQKVKTEYN